MDILAASSQQIDGRILRNVLSAFVTGVTVVTALGRDGRPIGCTANSFSSVSLNPPLVLWNQALKARSHADFCASERFVINILGEKQTALSQRFASDKIDDKFAGIEWTRGIGGLPLLDGCMAFLQCRKVATYPGGDHAIFVGHVEDLGHAGESNPLIFGLGRYMRAYGPEFDAVTMTEEPTQRHLQEVQLVRAALPEISRALGATVSLGVWGNHGLTSVAYELIPGPTNQNLRVGYVASTMETASGRLFAAYLPQAVTEPIIKDELAVATVARQTLPDEREWGAILDEVRAHGLARHLGSSRPELKDLPLAVFSAPVFDEANRMKFAIAAITHGPLANPDWDGPVPRKLKEFASSVSSQLGHQGIPRRKED